MPDEPRDDRDELSALLEDLARPEEEVRLRALRRLSGFPSLAVVHAIRRVAAEDPSVSLRFEARRMAGAVSERLSGEGISLADSAAGLQPLSPDEMSSQAALLAESKLRRICFDLRHDSPEVRLETLQSAAGARDPRLLKDVSRLLRDADPAVRHAAREAVRHLLPTAARRDADTERLQELEDDISAGGELASRAMEGVLDLARSCGIPATASVLSGCLGDVREPYLRARMLSALALIGNRTCLPAIQDCLQDADARVRATAVDALELVGNPEDRRAASACLEDPDPRVRAAAIRTLAASGDPSHLERLRTLIRSDLPAERAAGLYAARTIAFDRRFELLREHFLHETQPKLYEASAEAIARNSGASRKREVDALLEELPAGEKRACLEAALRRAEGRDRLEPGDLPSPPVSSHRPIDLAQALREPPSYSVILDLKSGGGLTPEMLREGLRRQSDPITVAALLEAAADMGLPDVVELATPYAGSKDRRIRCAVVEALGKVSSDDARETMARFVRDVDAEVSQRAVRRLQQHGTQHILACARGLLEGREPWEIKRGLELLETHGDRASMPLVLRVLERGITPEVVEPVTRLVTAWGDQTTLDRLSVLAHRAPASARPFLKELGVELGRALGLESGVVSAKLSEGPDVTIEPEPGPPPKRPGASRKTPPEPPPLPAAAPTRLIPPAVRVSSQAALSRVRELEPQWIVAGGCLLALLLLGAVWMLLPGKQPVDRSWTRPSRQSAKAAREEGRIRFEPPREGEKGRMTLPSVSFPSHYSIPVRRAPTLEEVEASLTRVLAVRGIQHAGVIRVMALDRVQSGYAAAIENARKLMDAGEIDRALRLLEQELLKLDPEHLSGRLALLRALVDLSRKGRRFDRMQEWTSQLAEIERKLLELIVEAGRESGLGEDSIRKAIEAMDERQKQQKQMSRASDWLSGADL